MQRRDFVAASLSLGAMPSAAADEAAPRRQRRVMAISAHPADYCSRAGGTLIRHVRAGDRVRVVWLTHGETNESQLLFQKRPDIPLDEVRRIREREAFASTEVIGAEGKMFGWGDNPLRVTPERMELLAREIADFKPDIILTHWKDELTYPTHWRAAQAVIEASQIADGSWDIRFFEPNIGTATRVGFLPDHYVDISDVFEKKMEALRKLETQPQLIGYYTTCNEWHGLEVKCRYAEAFVRWAPKVQTLKLLSDS